MTAESVPRRLKDLPVHHVLAGGTAMCAGCGGLQALHQACDLLGERTVVVNAAGCMTLLANYPYTPVAGSWLYTAMAAAPAGAQGVRDALDLRLATGRMTAAEDLQVMVLSGDGSAYGMGLASTSAAIERGLDFIYFCYDNEGYGNTGQQASDATPHGARTATTPAGAAPAKKDLFAIWAAHRPAYVATVIGSEPLDLARKIEKAKSLGGPRLILALSPCPTGWAFDPQQLTEIERLAVRTGVWPLKEYIDGRVVHTKLPSPRLPVADYLRTQGRFAHLFAPGKEGEIERMQATVDAYWEGVTA